MTAVVSLTVAAAAREGDTEALTRSLAAGSDVHQRDADGWNALDWASGRGDVDMILTLMEAGADPTDADVDGRTAFKTAVAAGHRTSAEVLRDAMRARGGSVSDTRWRPYCKAYTVEELAAYRGWPNDFEAAPGPDAVVYVHDDYTVTSGIWAGEDNVAVEINEDWKVFCRDVLRFDVPDELDLMP